MKAVIMAGGKGTRLQSMIADIPKPMVPVMGKPILEYQIESLAKSGISEITIIIGYLGNIIQEHFKDGNNWNVSINYIVEDKPLGTAGALFYLKNRIDDDFIILFGDLMLDIDWCRFMDFHKRNNSLVTLFAHPNAHPYDSDLIMTDEKNRVIGIDSKNNVRNYYYHNFVNAGLYCVNPCFLNMLEAVEKVDLEKDLITSAIVTKRVYAYRSTEYVKDMGTPDRFMTVLEDIKEGLVTSRSLQNKQKCIFLDRDGTINKLVGFLNSENLFELLPGVTEAIQAINKSEYLSIIATNQPVIARGECSFQELYKIHAKMETELGKEGAFIDDIFFCPHHPDKGYEGEIPELKLDCECRKPKIGMLTQAAEKYNIDLKNSWYVGDTTTDIQVGLNAGMHTILVLTGEAGKDGKYNVTPEAVASDLRDAVEIILNYR